MLLPHAACAGDLKTEQLLLFGSAATLKAVDLGCGKVWEEEDGFWSDPTHDGGSALYKCPEVSEELSVPDAVPSCHFQYLEGTFDFAATLMLYATLSHICDGPAVLSLLPQLYTTPKYLHLRVCVCLPQRTGAANQGSGQAAHQPGVWGSA